jgi:N6-L-threonylcarbamoyladenine synthase
MYLGFDTSNYTTSIALINNDVKQSKQVLNVKSGERGLRQSDAVFQHTVNIPKLIDDFDFGELKAVGVSNRPRNIDGSYMPCFLVGETVATSVAKTHNIPLYKTSHQVGHILAVLYGINRLDLINEKFIAFHLSGGTTEALLVTPDKDEIIKAEIIAQSNDLKAGQAIDRTGVMLGMTFPCGKEIDALASLSNQQYKIKPSMIGLDCSLSGVENKAKAMIQNGDTPENISKFVLTYIVNTVCAMIDGIVDEYGNMPIVFSGGVSSNSMLKNIVSNKYGAYFAKPEFSLDNAVGVAMYAKLKSEL